MDYLKNGSATWSRTHGLSVCLLPGDILHHFVTLPARSSPPDRPPLYLGPELQVKNKPACFLTHPKCVLCFSNIKQTRAKGLIFHSVTGCCFKCLLLPTRIELVLSRWCLIQLLSSMSFTLPDTMKFKKPHPPSDEKRHRAYYQPVLMGLHS